MTEDRGGDGDALSWGERRFLALLGLPSLALALAITTVSSFLPVLIHDVAGPALSGGLLAFEGIFALFLPALIGSWSDGTRTPLGPRLPFVLAAVPLAVIGLVAIPLMGSVVPIALMLMVFYLGYFTYFSPHFALYLDLVRDELRGRSQGAMNALREVGLAGALVAGPLFLSLGDAAPFFFAAAVMVLVSGVFVWRVAQRPEARKDPESSRDPESFGQRLTTNFALFRRHPHVRRLLLANTLWEVALNGLRAFVVLYFVEGLGRSPSTVSAVLGVVAVTAIVTSPLTGKLSDRIGELPILRWATWVYGVGVIVPAFLHDTWVVAIVPFVAAAAMMVMTLPFSLLMAYVPEEEHGAATGAFGISRGLGLIGGPLLAGVLITLLDGVLTGTDGFGAVFIVASAAILASKWFIARLPDPDEGGRRDEGADG